MALDLKEVEQSYKEALKLPTDERNRELVNLMNLMEQNYKVFILNPTEEQMNQPHIKLYRKISEARIF